MSTGVLFRCVANSARSQMAEGWARHLLGDRVQVWSAGSEPSRVNAFAVRAMAEVGIDLSDHHSKSVATIDPAPVDVVITLCAEESCPLFLGDAERISWAMPDPDTSEPLSDDDRLQRFRDARDVIGERVRGLAARLGA